MDIGLAGREGERIAYCGEIEDVDGDGDYSVE